MARRDRIAYLQLLATSPMPVTGSAPGVDGTAFPSSGCVGMAPGGPLDAWIPLWTNPHPNLPVAVTIEARFTDPTITVRLARTVDGLANSRVATLATAPGSGCMAGPVILDGGATLYASNTTGRELTPADKMVVSFFDPSAHLPGW